MANEEQVRCKEAEEVQRVKEHCVIDEDQLQSQNLAIATLFVNGKILQAESEQHLAKLLDGKHEVNMDCNEDIKMIAPVLQIGNSVNVLQASTTMLSM